MSFVEYCVAIIFGIIIVYPFVSYYEFYYESKLSKIVMYIMKATFVVSLISVAVVSAN